MRVSESHNEEILHRAIHHRVLESSSIKIFHSCRGVTPRPIFCFDSCARSMVLTPHFDTLSLSRSFFGFKRLSHSTLPTIHPPSKRMSQRKILRNIRSQRFTSYLHKNQPKQANGYFDSTWLKIYESLTEGQEMRTLRAWFVTHFVLSLLLC